MFPQSTDDVIIHLHALSATPRGPFAWCARIVTEQGTGKCGGYSTSTHFTRLMIEGSIKALTEAAAGSSVLLQCSDPYLERWVFDRLDKLSGDASKPRRKRKHALKNLDLFPALQEAKARHRSVRVETVSKGNWSGEHEATARRAKEMLAEMGTDDPRNPHQAIIATPQTVAGASPPW